MRAELANLYHCAVTFLSRAAVNLSWYDSINIVIGTITEIFLFINGRAPCWHGSSVLAWQLRVGMVAPCWHGSSVLAWQLRVGMAAPCWHGSSVLAWQLRVGMAAPCWHGSSVLAWQLRVGMAAPCWHGSSVLAWQLRVGMAAPCWHGSNERVRLYHAIYFTQKRKSKFRKASKT